MEDLSLGKLRFREPMTTVAASTVRVLIPDPRRVAIIASLNAGFTFDNLGTPVQQDVVVAVAGDSIAGQEIIRQVYGSQTTILKLEELGDLIQGSWSVVIVNQTGLARCTLTPICFPTNIPEYKK